MRIEQDLVRITAGPAFGFHCSLHRANDRRFCPRINAPHRLDVRRRAYLTPAVL